MLLKLLRRLFSYLFFAMLLMALTVGLLNTYLGADSPLRPAAERVAATVAPLSNAVRRSWDDLRSGAPLAGPSISTEALKPANSSAGVAIHDSVDGTGSLCLPEGVREVPLWSEQKAYAWVNEDGVKSFGDEAPAQPGATTVTTEDDQRVVCPL